jgi:lipopolysaccharide/colanic/teichoic acid biosynthesis glycosyltransferase
MARFAKLLTPVLIAAIVLLIDDIHGHRHESSYLNHYELTTEPRFGWLLALIALIWIATYAVGVNEPGLTHGQRYIRSAGGVGSAVVIILALQLVVARKATLPLFDTALSFVTLALGLAVVASTTQRSLTLQGEQERIVALVGDDERERLLRDVSRRPERPSVVAATLAPAAAGPGEGGAAPLEDVIKDQRITLVVMNREAQASDAIVSQAARVHAQGVRIRTLSLYYDEWLGKLPLAELERIALLFDINEIHRPVYARMKRFLDVLLALAGLPVLLLAVPLVAVLDLFGNRGSLFYHQERVGKDGAVFMIHKFRTMRASDAPSSWTEPDDARLTAVGRILRRLHIDELPQVWNVLRRDLSIVGPRPEQPRYVAQLSDVIPFYDTRHLVRPGITGWAQVKYDYGASELDALEKLQYEFYYLRHQSLALDLRIMGRTLRSIVGRQGR